MPQTLRMPDSEAIAIGALQAAGVADGRVYSKIPPSPVYPLVVVQRLGGVAVEKRKLDAARIQCDIWGELDSETDDGEGKGRARDIGEDVRFELHELEGQTIAELDAQVTCVEDETGLQWQPDEEDGRPRYHLSVTLYAQSARIISS